jgi:hypothetical protein
VNPDGELVINMGVVAAIVAAGLVLGLAIIAALIKMDRRGHYSYLERPKPRLTRAEGIVLAAGALVAVAAVTTLFWRQPGATSLEYFLLRMMILLPGVFFAIVLYRQKERW